MSEIYSNNSSSDEIDKVFKEIVAAYEAEDRAHAPSAEDFFLYLRSKDYSDQEIRDIFDLILTAEGEVYEV